MSLSLGAVTSTLSEHPLSIAAVIVALGMTAVGAGIALRRVSRRSRSLFHQLLALTLASLAIGAAGAVVLARLMIVDESELGTVLAVLATTAVLSTVLVIVASKPLARDMIRLERAVRRIELGDRTGRSGVDRADELGHVARALDELTERLDHFERERERYEAERKTLLSSVSHDLRTPLAALQVSTEALADGIAPDPERYVRSMKRDVQAISSLVDDLFLLARIEHDEISLERQLFDLAEIADEAIEALSPVAEARGVTLQLTTTERVRARGNPTAIGRVIRNLIDNAVRHAPDHSVVVVAVSAEPGATVRVVDEGPGFPIGFETRAFEDFTRADVSRSRNTGGAGLGLAIARGLVEAHGGRIWIEPAPRGEVAFAIPAA
jgi:signal transduction histidine kinase